MRAALLHKGKLLLLQKDGTSRIPGSFEFPGGKIDNQLKRTPTLQEQEAALVSEVQEETGIDIRGFDMKKVDEFTMLFEDSASPSHEVRRSKIRLFLVHIPDDTTLSVLINQTKNADGEPEDKHGAYLWVTPVELGKLAASFVDNPYKKKRTRLLARNSRRVSKLLHSLGSEE